jgi:hypothetical protein
MDFFVVNLSGKHEQFLRAAQFDATTVSTDRLHRTAGAASRAVDGP